MRLHYIDWTEDQAQNDCRLATIPVGDALATLPFKLPKQNIIRIIMPMPYNEGFYTIRLQHRRVVVDTEVIHAWVILPPNLHSLLNPVQYKE